MTKMSISLGLSGACKGSSDEKNAVGCDNAPTHLQWRRFATGGGLVAWCCECYVLEGGEDCSYTIEEE